MHSADTKAPGIAAVRRIRNGSIAGMVRSFCGDLVFLSCFLPAARRSCILESDKKTGRENLPQPVRQPHDAHIFSITLSNSALNRPFTRFAVSVTSAWLSG